MRLFFLFLALTNASPIIKKNLHGFQNGLSYQSPVQTSSGWRYLSAHARSPSLPTPSTNPLATASPSASATATLSSSSFPSASVTATPTSQTTSSSSPSAYPTSPPTASPSISSTPSTTSSHRIIPLSPHHGKTTSDRLIRGSQTRECV